MQARCAHDPNLTVVSLDASAAYDGISRQSILQELRSLPAAAALLPFARLWLGRPSSFVWQQGATTRHLRQAEGVEQGDPLSPALFCLCLQPALTLHRELREDLGERVLAYLDDVTILAAPERVLHLVRRFEHHLARHTRLRLNVDKTAIWNGAGLTPDGLGETLLSSLPGLGDTQVSWLLLLYTAAPRAQFALRTLPLRLTRDFAHAHDARVLTVLSALLLAEGPSPLPPAAARVAQLALRHGGLGLRSAALHAPAAYWASWADAVAVLHVRDAPLVNSLVQALDNRSVLEWSPVQDLAQASDALAEAGFAVPRWADLPRHCPAPAPDDADPDDPDVPYRGWQRSASRVLDDRASAEHRRAVGPAELALLDSQSGPFAARLLTVRPVGPEFALDSALFRVLLLRRLRLPLPLAPARCRCGRPLDAVGDHVAACPRSGVLRARGGPLERAAARVCREAGAAVATHVLVRDLNLQAHRHDERRIEVIANGLPLWGGSQLAVDTTLVSPLTSAGVPRRRRGSTAGAALAEARRAKERTYPEFADARGAAWLCSVLKLGVAGVPKLPPSSACSRRRGRAVPP